MYTLVVLVLAVAASVQGYPSNNDDIIEAAAAGNWEEVRKLLASGLDQDDTWRSLGAGDIKNLKPVQGGHVYGESEFTIHESSDVNGQKTEQSAGHKVINDDGKISEYDFKPQISH